MEIIVGDATDHDGPRATLTRVWTGLWPGSAQELGDRDRQLGQETGERSSPDIAARTDR